MFSKAATAVYSIHLSAHSFVFSLACRDLPRVQPALKRPTSHVYSTKGTVPTTGMSLRRPEYTDAPTNSEQDGGDVMQPNAGIANQQTLSTRTFT